VGGGGVLIVIVPKTFHKKTCGQFVLLPKIECLFVYSKKENWKICSKPIFEDWSGIKVLTHLNGNICVI